MCTCEYIQIAINHNIVSIQFVMASNQSSFFCARLTHVVLLVVAWLCGATKITIQKLVWCGAHICICVFMLIYYIYIYIFICYDQCVINKVLTLNQNGSNFKCHTACVCGVVSGHSWFLCRFAIECDRFATPVNNIITLQTHMHHIQSIYVQSRQIRQAFRKFRTNFIDLSKSNKKHLVFRTIQQGKKIKKNYFHMKNWI